MSSKHLDSRQIHSVEKIGNAMFPGGDGFPSFSELGCVRHLDRILDYMPARDLKDLRLLLSLLAFFPQFMIRAFVRFLESGARWPGPIGGILRTIRLGLRGLIMSLYYGDPDILKRIDYDVGVYTDDVKR